MDIVVHIYNYKILQYLNGLLFENTMSCEFKILIIIENLDTKLE